MFIICVLLVTTYNYRYSHSNLRYIIIIFDAVQRTACIKYNLLNISQVCVEAAAIGPYCCDLQSG